MKKSVFTVLFACSLAIYLLSACVQGESVKATPGLMSDKQFADTSNSRYWQHSKNKEGMEVATPSADSSKMVSPEEKKESVKQEMNDSKKDKK